MSGNKRAGLPVVATKKRKERDGVTTKAEPSPAPAWVVSGGNRLLAGYLAHEFLTHGTLLGQPWAPAPARSGGAEPSRSGGAEPAKPKPSASASPAAQAPAYADVARLVRVEGAHVPGVVNPTQLGQWLQTAAYGKLAGEERGRSSTRG